jgi:hypothetical protein
MIEVSIIIPTYQRHKDLKRLLASIAELDYPASKLEVVVVDNAGDLAEKDLKTKVGKAKLTLARPDENLYCSGARFYGAKIAKGHYFFFIDDDNVMSPESITELVASFKDTPNLGVAAPLMMFYKDKHRIWAAGVRLSRLGRPVYLYGNAEEQASALPETISDIDAFPNAFMVKRDVLEAVPFDVTNFPHNWSEADFGLRIKRHGYGGITNTRARVWHDIDYGGLLTRTDRVKVYDQAKSRILFRKRFATPLSWVIFWIVTFPISSFYYLKAIQASPDKNKLAMLGRYIQGTFDGVKTPITKDVKKLPQISNSAPKPPIPAPIRPDSSAVTTVMPDKPERTGTRNGSLLASKARSGEASKRVRLAS